MVFVFEMACFWPIKGYKSGYTDSGKIKIVFRRGDSERAEEIYLPCGSCLGCKLEHARQWSVRCLHEASLYEDNCFITLTYDDENLPFDMSLDVAVWQGFMKSLRKKFGDGIRYFACGEYGEKFGRPHYHGILFNHDFKDKVLFSERDGERLFTSETLQGIWKKGFSTVGSVSEKSAGYVARYNMKKVNKFDRDKVDQFGLKPYERVNLETGLTWEVKPEFVLMSRGGRSGNKGIGQGWFEKFKTDVFPSDEVMLNGRKTRPPKYYDYLLDKSDHSMFESLKLERERKGKKLVPVGNGILVNDYTDPWRCESREVTARQKIKLLIRPMEEEI